MMVKCVAQNTDVSTPVCNLYPTSTSNFLWKIYLKLDLYAKHNLKVISYWNKIMMYRNDTEKMLF